MEIQFLTNLLFSIQLGNFEVYIKYAVTLGKAEALIGKSKDTVSSNFYSDRVSLKHFLHLPMKNISDYLSTFNEILDDSFSNGGTMTNLFKYCAIIEVDFNQLQRRCMENYRLYSLKDEKVRGWNYRVKSAIITGNYLSDSLQDPRPSRALGCGLVQRAERVKLQVAPHKIHADLCEHPK